jgi:hypothetical protein
VGLEREWQKVGLEREWQKVIFYIKRGKLE